MSRCKCCGVSVRELTVYTLPLLESPVTNIIESHACEYIKLAHEM